MIWAELNAYRVPLTVAITGILASIGYILTLRGKRVMGCALIAAATFLLPFFVLGADPVILASAAIFPLVSIPFLAWGKRRKPVEGDLMGDPGVSYDLEKDSLDVSFGRSGLSYLSELTKEDGTPVAGFFLTRQMDDDSVNGALVHGFSEACTEARAPEKSRLVFEEGALPVPDDVQLLKTVCKGLGDLTKSHEDKQKAESLLDIMFACAGRLLSMKGIDTDSMFEQKRSAAARSVKNTKESVATSDSKEVS